MTAYTIKKMFNDLEKAEAEMDRLDTLWESDVTNEDFEKAWDACYATLSKRFWKLAEAITTFSGGRIDRQTAATMLRMKRSEIRDLCARLA